MSDTILSVVYLLLVLCLILPGFYYANKNKKDLILNALIWFGIIGLIVIFYKVLST